MVVHLTKGTSRIGTNDAETLLAFLDLKISESGKLGLRQLVLGANDDMLATPSGC